MRSNSRIVYIEPNSVIVCIANFKMDIFYKDIVFVDIKIEQRSFGIGLKAIIRSRVFAKVRNIALYPHIIS